MRDLKFRAWDKINGNMLFDVSTGTIKIWSSPDNRSAESKDCDFMQFTGLLDKNGKEIYEGDIVTYGDDRPAEIVFERGQFTFAYEKDTMPNTRMGLGYYFGGTINEIEVIGNKFENPSLLV